MTIKTNKTESINAILSFFQTIVKIKISYIDVKIKKRNCYYTHLMNLE